MLLRFFMSFPNFPQCQSEYTYQDGELFICPECSHEWKPGEGHTSEQQEIITDSNSNVLADADSVTVVNDLKIKGYYSVEKDGTKLKTSSFILDGSVCYDIYC